MPNVARVVALVCAGILGYLVWRLLSPFGVPIVWATLFAFFLNPIQRKLVKKWNRPLLVSAVLTTGVLVLVVVPVTAFGTAVLRQALQLVQRFQMEASNRDLPFLQFILETRPVQVVLEKITGFTSLTTDEILAKVAEAAQSLAQKLGGWTGSLLMSTFTILIQFLLTLLLLFFFLRDGDRMFHRVLRLAPLPAARKDDLVKQIGGVTRAAVLGAMATALIQGTLMGIGFTIVGLPSPLVFGALGGVASLIPVVGTGLVWVPASLILLIQGKTTGAIILAVWCAVLVAGADNVVRPLIISGGTKKTMSTLFVFLGLIGGIASFGLAGVFVGPVILTVAGAVLKYFDETQPDDSLPAPAAEDPQASLPLA